eukprot:6177058-Pleurochrysis_carterae.AAC.1
MERERGIAPISWEFGPVAATESAAARLWAAFGARTRGTRRTAAYAVRQCRTAHGAARRCRA